MDVNFNSIEMMEDVQTNSEVDELLDLLVQENAGTVPVAIQQQQVGTDVSIEDLFKEVNKM